MNKIKSPYGPLSKEEKKIIESCGTEQPFTGKNLREERLGLYACRKCGTPLFRSEDKFEAFCGWLSFDDSISGKTEESPDPDGKRTAVSCVCCGGHLGHVFKRERLTEKNIRFCINSCSAVFEPQDGGRLARAMFAGGCFWGIEDMMKKLPGVIAATPGYCGGNKDFPVYREVSVGTTGHSETVEVVYETEKLPYEKLCEYFFEIHDPSQRNRQGADIGSQYRSAIFYLTGEQKAIAEKTAKRLSKTGVYVVTEIKPFIRFWNAEPYHRNYYERNGGASVCHVWRKKF